MTILPLPIAAKGEPLPNVQDLAALKEKGLLPASWDVPFTHWESNRMPDNSPPNDAKKLFGKDGFY